jgi:hypothetical protein
MAALATDLRRHLAHLPLCGVRNRSLIERWRKWRRRQPHGVAFLIMMLAILTAGGAAVIGAASFFRQRLPEVHRALEEGKQEMERGEWDGAIKTFQHGLSVVQGIPLQRSLAEELGVRLRLAEQKRTTQELHQLANWIRFLGGADPLPVGGLRGLEASCRSFWENRVRIVEQLMPAGAVALEPNVRDDLCHLAIFWAELQGRLVPPGEKEEARRQVLSEAEVLFGPSPVLKARAHGPATTAGMPERSPQWR